MNWNQLKALVWLRWRLFMVQFRKMSIWIKILLGFIAVSMLLTAVGGSIFAFVGTIYLMPEDQPWVALLAIDGLVGIFLFAWLAGFVSELQRDEPLSIEKLLHLPMSVRGAFLLNFLSSFASLTIVALLPPLVGLCLALPFVYGWKALVGLPLLAAFMLLVTSVTYQIRGWLGRMMANPKRRRAIMTGIVMAFIAVTQLPGILTTVFSDNDSDRDRDKVAEVQAEGSDQSAPVTGNVEATPDATIDEQPPTLTEESESAPEVATGEAPDESANASAAETPIEAPTAEEIAKQKQAFELRQEARKARRAAKRKRALAILTKVNQYVPLGWFPFGLYRAAEGVLWPGLLGLVGLLGLAATSLNMSYRATLNFYRGTTRKKRTADTERNRIEQERPAKNRELKSLPFLPPKLGTITRTNLTNMWRTPAVKMQLLIPFFVMFIPLAGLLKKRDKLPPEAAPLVGLGIVFFAMFMMFGLTMNIFGFDRNGFRSYMLLPLRPRNLLLAKNISMSPIVCVMCILPFGVVIVLFSFSWTDVLACVAQLLSTYTIFCILGNAVSTMFPFPMPSSSMKRVKPKWQAMLAQMGAFFAAPFLMIPVAAPPVAAFALKKFDIWTGFSFNLPLSLAVAALAVGFYWLMLDPLSRLLWNKQRDILLEVSKAE